MLILLCFFVYLSNNATTAKHISAWVEQHALKREAPKESGVLPGLTIFPEQMRHVVRTNSSEILITLDSPSLFREQTDEIAAAKTPFLEQIAKELLLTGDFRVAIEVYEPPLFAEDDSWELGLARASSVYRFFLDHGLPSQTLRAATRSPEIDSNEAGYVRLTLTH